MTIADIPSDELVVMTENLSRLFCAGGCKPACHGCGKKLAAGVSFKLSSIDVGKDVFPHDTRSHNVPEKKAVDVMLCETCEPNLAIARKLQPGHGCFRVDGKIATDS